MLRSRCIAVIKPSIRREATTDALCVFKKRRSEMSLVVLWCFGRGDLLGNAVTSFKEAQGLLVPSRFLYVFRLHHTRGHRDWSGRLWRDAVSPPARCAFFHTVYRHLRYTNENAPRQATPMIIGAQSPATQASGVMSRCRFCRDQRITFRLNKGVSTSASRHTEKAAL
jgi:hypothetical protein